MTPEGWSGTPIPGKVHRIYATTHVTPIAGQFVKIKGTSVAKFADSPENATEDFNIKDIAQVDKVWYTTMAMKKFEAFCSETL